MIHDKFVDSAVALADSVLKALWVDCNTWSSDFIDGDDQGLMFIYDYIEIIKNLIIKVYLERVAECDKK